MMWYVDFRNSWCVLVCVQGSATWGCVVLCVRKSRQHQLTSLLLYGVRREASIESVVINNFHDFYVGCEKTYL